MASFADRRRLEEMHYINLVEKNTLPAPETHEELALKNMIQSTLTSELYFSKKNIDAMHVQIITRVADITGRTISQQSDDELFIVMRSIYLQYSDNNPTSYVDEVRWLNTMVLEYVIPNIVVNMQEYLKYLQDAGKVSVPMDRGIYVTPTRMRSLQLQNPGVV